MKWKQRYLRDTVSGVGHNDLDEACEYYVDVLKTGGFYQNPTRIDTLEDLYQVLNNLEGFSEGNRWKMEEWKFSIGGE